MADENPEGFDFEKAASVSGLSAGGFFNDEDDDHAEQARQSYRESWEADESRVFVSEDGRATYAEYSYGESGAQRDTADVEDASILDEAAAGTFTPTEPPKSEPAELIGRYRDACDQWKSGFDTATNAHTVAELQQIRTATMQEILSQGLTHDERLDGYESYLSSDIAWLSRPDPRDSEYADYVRQRDHIRHRVFGTEDEEVLNTAEAYARATGATSQAMVDEVDIEQHYEFLSVRQEAVLEHFNDPRFVAEVGLYSRNKIDDELLVDFDRWDLRDDKAKGRSQVMADVFGEMVHPRPDEKARGIAKIERFQELRETGRAISHNQDAIIRFARSSQPDVDGDPGRIDAGSLELGLQALDNKSYSDGLFKEWLDSMPLEERKSVENEPVALLRKSRETFQRDYDALGRGEAIEGSSLGASFAVMERSAQEILRNYPKYNRDGQLNNPDDLGSLAIFSKKYREKKLDSIPEKIDRKMMERLGDEELLHDGAKDGTATRAAKSKGGEGYTVDLSESGNNTHVEVVDGNHVRISNSAEDAKDGKFVQLRLEGLTVPAMGQQTKNGMLDAGEEAKSHLEGFVARYTQPDSFEKMGLQIVENDNGEKVLKATLPAGESLSQRMIRDGYGLPTKEGEGLVRREELAKGAEKERRGIWRDGFPEVDRTWRSEARSPSLSAKDKRERLTDMVGLSMACDVDQVGAKLSHRETKIFALELKPWSTHPNVDKAISKVARTNPGRLMDIYDNNLEILKDLRKRKDKLTPAEKIAHDRLDMGRRAIGGSLMEYGHMSPEQLKKDGHPMMSRKGINANLDSLRPITNAAGAAANVASKYAKEGVKRAPGMVRDIFQMVDEP